MKNKLTFIAIIAFSFSIKAQLFTPGGTVQGASINDNIGIGTSNTVAKLTIQAGPNNYPTPLKAISIWGPNSPANANSAQDLSWDFASAGSAVIRSYRGGGYDTYIQFMTNSQYTGANVPQVRMHINEDGNIGIGTNNPEKKLQINASNTDAGLRLHTSDGNNNTNTPYLLLTGGYLPNNGVALRGIGDQNYGRKALVFYSGWEGNLDNPAITDLQERMRISSSGNVGIGTINPLNKLDVKGTIHSQEVKVDMLNWSDFVFKKEYNLPTLQEVEKHIAEKGHLENIPSEKEVLENGINLGEMNAKLLQKIEELTLYMIEMKKDITALKQENQELKLEICKN